MDISKFSQVSGEIQIADRQLVSRSSALYFLHIRSPLAKISRPKRQLAVDIKTDAQLPQSVKIIHVD